MSKTSDENVINIISINPFLNKKILQHDKCHITGK